MGCPLDTAERGAVPAASGYVAFVRRAGAPTRMVRFDGPTLDRLIERWYDAIAGAAYAPPTEGQAVAEATAGAFVAAALWRPLSAHLHGVDRVFLVPDGLLHFVSWYALPAGRDRYLIDEPRQLHLLTAETELARRPDSPERPSGQAVVVLAEPRLVAEPVDDAGDAPGSAPALRSACVFVDPRRLPRLGDARAEALALEAEARDAGRPVLLATGEDASESWLRAHGPGAGLIHIAAHAGQLAPESCRVAPAAGDAAAEATLSLWEASVRARPLMRSGLLLAGSASRNAATGGDDGLLVAEEAARLDLRAADWVVLSACSSRRGVVLDGEGMLGLHRAFHAAGARTVIASLWDVEDAQARRFMRALYAARLRRGLTAIDSVRVATRAVLDELRGSGQSTHPARWAAFVASGDWR